MEEDLTELLFKNRNNTHEIKKHLKDYMQKFRRSIIWKSLTPKAQKNIKDITEDIQKEIELTKVQTLSEKDIKKPEAFVQDFLLDYEFNFVVARLNLARAGLYYQSYQKDYKQITRQDLFYRPRMINTQ